METRKLSKNKNWRLVDIIEEENNDTTRIKNKVADNSGQKEVYVLEYLEVRVKDMFSWR